VTRRTAVAVLAARAVNPATTKSVAEIGNTFHAFWKQWADEINATPPTAVSNRAIAIGRQMDEAYKVFRRKRINWEQGIG
jgi:heat shock protein HslJ